MRDKIKAVIEVQEMSDVDVRRISIVKAGANMIPWRILKHSDQPGAEDSDMKISFGSIFGTSKPEGPRVSSVAVSKAADLEASKLHLQAAGFSIDTVEETEDAVLFVQDADVRGERVVMKLDDNHAIVVANVEKGLATYPESVSFADNLASAGFLPGVQLGISMLHDTIYNSVQKAENQSVAVTTVSKAIEDFRSYVMALAGSLPVEAFKLDSILKSAPKVVAQEKPVETVAKTADGTETPTETKEVTKGDEAPVETESKSNTEQTEKVEAVKSDEAPTEADAASDKEVVKADTGATSEQVTEEVAKADEATETEAGTEIQVAKEAEAKATEAPATEPSADWVSIIKSAVAEAVAPIQTKLDEVTERVETVAKAADEAAEAVHGTIHTSDDEPTQRVIKNTNGLRGRAGDELPFLDTGLARRDRGARPGLTL